MTDLYPDEEGHISDGLMIDYCLAAGSITQFSAVTLSASNIGYLTVTNATYQNGVGVALRAVDTNDWTPVVFYGVVKMTCSTSNAVAIMSTVVSDTTAGQCVGMPVVADTADNNYADNNGTGTMHKLGMALQACTTTGDEILVLIGGNR